MGKNKPLAYVLRERKMSIGKLKRADATCWRWLLAEVVSYYHPAGLAFGGQLYIIIINLNRRNEYYTIRSKSR